MSLYQKDANGARTAEEAASFKRALNVMGSLYASLTGTCVLLQRTVSTPPNQLADDEAGGQVAAWNTVPYEERGWTTFEQGVARVAAAHVATALAQLERQKRTAPDAMRRALESRAKLVDIGGEAAAPLFDAPLEEPLALLRATTAAISRATFTNSADRRAVQRLVFGFEWTMHMAVDSVLAQHSGGALLTAKPRRRPAPHPSKSQLLSSRPALSARDEAPPRHQADGDGVQLWLAVRPGGGDADGRGRGGTGGVVALGEGL